jgi:ubiquinol-cytochrome c reductase cytochrome b subunit
VNILWTIWDWFDDRTGVSKLVKPFLFHPVPRQTASLKIGWMYLFGIATLVSFMVQVTTGVGLATLYVPSTANAYDSLKFITDEATLGRVLRGMHFWGASAMVLFVGIHMIRVYLTGSFKFPREMNWVSGVVLLLLTIGMGFTGQLLRWDQNGVWSLFVGAEQAGRLPVAGAWIAHFMLGGSTIGAATLSRFFAFHVFFIPALIFAVVGFHLYLVIHNGISEPPVAGQRVDKRTYRHQYHDLIDREGLPYFPDAAWHEIGFGVLLVLVILLLAIFVGPPQLDNPPNPANVLAFPRPDWYLLWYYALLALLRPSFEDYFIILAPLFGFLVLFLVPFISHSGERSPLRRPWAPAIVVGLVIVIGALWRYGSVGPWSPDFSAQPLNAAQIGATSGPVFQGAALFYQKGCEYCHTVDGQGGIRGPDLTRVADRLTEGQITATIADGRGNMPAYINNLKPDEMEAIVAFLDSRSKQPSPGSSGAAAPAQAR